MSETTSVNEANPAIIGRDDLRGGQAPKDCAENKNQELKQWVCKNGSCHLVWSVCSLFS